MTRIRYFLISFVIVGTVFLSGVPFGNQTGPFSTSKGIVAAHPTPEGGANTPTPGSGTNTSGMTMHMTANGTVVNQNRNTAPPSCSGILGTRVITVRGGTQYATAGEMFSFKSDVYRVDPCMRVVVTFINTDHIRHQWMVHGLPRSVYPGGMFSLEVTGPGRITGAFITPGTDQTLRVHCSLPQHDEKGMHARLIVGEGNPTPTVTTTAQTQRPLPGFTFLATLCSLLLAGFFFYFQW